MARIVFSDVDGTLLNSAHAVTDCTRRSVHALIRRGIPFVIVSARGPAELEIILEQLELRCPCITFSGALTLDEEGRTLHETGMSAAQAGQIVSFLAEHCPDAVWNVFAGDDWLTADRSDPRVTEEEQIVRVRAREGRPETLAADRIVHKLLCMCPPERIFAVGEAVRARFPSVTAAPSSPTLLELLPAGVNKAKAALRLCERLGIPPAEAAAFGDQYNDLELLQAVGTGFLMGNAPLPLRASVPLLAPDNDSDGLARILDTL